MSDEYEHENEDECGFDEGGCVGEGWCRSTQTRSEIDGREYAFGERDKERANVHWVKEGGRLPARVRESGGGPIQIAKGVEGVEGPERFRSDTFDQYVHHHQRLVIAYPIHTAIMVHPKHPHSLASI